MRRLASAVVAVLAVTLLGGSTRRHIVAPSPTLNLDLRRSFAITDQAILDGFSLERVMNAIVRRSGARTDAGRVIRQMFDTQNPKPGLVSANAPHCDDFMTSGKPQFNGVSRRCPTAEGALASRDPFVQDTYIPLAIVNRFDLTPADGANCGQYRVIFARKSEGQLDHVHLIFEAVLPNPDRSAGIAGCRAVAEFWASLSRIDSVSTRRAELERFFFTGIENFEPVFDATHFSANSGGGIRAMFTNIGSGQIYRFYQFRLEVRGAELIAEPDVFENMPLARFFDASNTSESARSFRKHLLTQVRTLAIDNANGYFMNTPREFLVAEGDPFNGEVDLAFLTGLFTFEGQSFSHDIESELRRVGSKLSARDLATRAYTQSCVGCHFGTRSVGNGVKFPNSLDLFQHVSEDRTELGDDGPRFAISPAMRDVFIPARIEILRRFLTSGAAPVHSN